MSMENTNDENKAKIELKEKGPVFISGNYVLKGYEQLKGEIYLCRCAKSKSLPFCDGSHKSQPS